MKTKYSDLLSTKRFRPSSVSNRSIIAEAESDRGRLIYCPAFRRLQQKAQVFSMESNAAVRSRLTHSLEVSQMGRYIADELSPKLIEKELASKDECTALVTFVETACLMHDIGNPPFGHFGEAAISKWFQDNGYETLKSACCNGDPGALGTSDPRIVNALADFQQFDGNPQGLRVVTKLQRNSDGHGLNLTKTTIASYLKYVRSSSQTPSEVNSSFTKKCGYFVTEKEIVESVWKEFNYSSPQRFPLAYIMEAADDIAYCISDLEDSIEKGLLDKKTTFYEIHDQWKIQKFYESEENLAQEINDILEKAAAGKLKDSKKFTYIDFRTSLNRTLVNYCVKFYIQHHQDILSGTINSLIPEESAAGKILEILKKYCRTRVYCHESVQRIELSGYTAIYGLLDKFKCLLECDSDRFSRSLNYSENKDKDGKAIIIEKKLLSLFPKNYIKIYEEEVSKLEATNPEHSFQEWNHRAHLITDFLSGMTDDFAMTTYQTLSGMKL